MNVNWVAVYEDSKGETHNKQFAAPDSYFLATVVFWGAMLFQDITRLIELYPAPNTFSEN